MSINKRELEAEVDRLFDRAEKERFTHSRSEKTFDAIAGLWFLGPGSERILSQIACSYIVSSFLLESLSLIYQRIRADYDLPEFDSRTLADDVSAAEFTQALAKFEADSEFVAWLQDTLLPKCEELLRRVRTDDLSQVASLGNLADSTEHVAKDYSQRADDATWIYDSVFQFHDAALPSSDALSAHYSDALSAHYYEHVPPLVEPVAITNRESSDSGLRNSRGITDAQLVA